MPHDSGPNSDNLTAELHAVGGINGHWQPNTVNL
jgi:hypothetical protein